MILVDTSVWVDHLRRGNDRLRNLLEEGNVLSHPFVVGELACGHLKNRDEILALMDALPEARVADQHEVLHLIHRHRLYAGRLGWVDAHLLAAALLNGSRLWTLDKPLAKAARSLRIDA
jgi:predicted nucleic acid-binding protein